MSWAGTSLLLTEVESKNAPPPPFSLATVDGRTVDFLVQF